MEGVVHAVANIVANVLGYAGNLLHVRVIPEFGDPEAPANNLRRFIRFRVGPGEPLPDLPEDERNRWGAWVAIETLETWQDFQRYYRGTLRDEHLRPIHDAHLGARGEPLKGKDLLQRIRDWAQDMNHYIATEGDAIAREEAFQQYEDAIELDTHRNVCLQFVRALTRRADVSRDAVEFVVHFGIDDFRNILKTVLPMDKANTLFVMRRERDVVATTGMLWHAAQQVTELRKDYAWKNILGEYIVEDPHGGARDPNEGTIHHRLFRLLCDPSLALTDLKCWVRPEIPTELERNVLFFTLYEWVHKLGTVLTILWMAALMLGVPIMDLVCKEGQADVCDHADLMKTALLFVPLGLSNSFNYAVRPFAGRPIIVVALATVAALVLNSKISEIDNADDSGNARPLIFALVHTGSLLFFIYWQKTGFVVIDPSCLYVFAMGVLKNAVAMSATADLWFTIMPLVNAVVCFAFVMAMTRMFRYELNDAGVTRMILGLFQFLGSGSEGGDIAITCVWVVMLVAAAWWVIRDLLLDFTGGVKFPA